MNKIFSRDFVYNFSSFLLQAIIFFLLHHLSGMHMWFLFWSLACDFTVGRLFRKCEEQCFAIIPCGGSFRSIRQPFEAPRKILSPRTTENQSRGPVAGGVDCVSKTNPSNLPVRVLPAASNPSNCHKTTEFIDFCTLTHTSADDDRLSYSTVFGHNPRKCSSEQSFCVDVCFVTNPTAACRVFDC